MRNSISSRNAKAKFQAKKSPMRFLQRAREWLFYEPCANCFASTIKQYQPQYKFNKYSEVKDELIVV